LVNVVEADSKLSLGLRFGQRRQQQPRQDRDDGDDHEEPDDREGGQGL
jgi:hypothetical protein